MRPVIMWIVFTGRGYAVTERRGPFDTSDLLVTTEAGRWSCTCGRRRCRHVRAVQAERERLHVGR